MALGSRDSIMAKAKPKSTAVRVNLPVSTLSDKERTETMSAIGTMAPASTFYQQHQQVHAAVDAAVKDGADLGTADQKVTGAEANLDLLRESRSTSRGRFMLSSGVMRSIIEAAGPTPRGSGCDGALRLHRQSATGAARASDGHQGDARNEARSVSCLGGEPWTFEVRCSGKRGSRRTDHLAGSCRHRQATHGDGAPVGRVGVGAVPNRARAGAERLVHAGLGDRAVVGR